MRVLHAIKLFHECLVRATVLRDLKLSVGVLQMIV